MSSANVVSSISLDPVLKLLSHPGAMRCCLRPVAANEHTALVAPAREASGASRDDGLNHAQVR